MDDKRRILYLYAVLALFLVIHIIPLVATDTLLWGADQARYVPAAAFFLLVAVAVPASFPKVWIRAAAVFDRPPESGKGLAGKALTALLLASAAILFWYARNRTHFLGDGYLWASHLKDRAVFNEPAISWIYRGILDLARAAGFEGATPVTVSALISVASGLLFLVYALKTSFIAAEDGIGRLFIFLALISCGSMMLFFGYVEAYPPLAAAVMIFTYYGIRALSGRSSPLPAVLFFILSAALHLSAIALLPALLTLFWMRDGRTVGGRRYFFIVASLMALGLAALYLLQGTGAFSSFFFETFLPLFSASGRNRVAYPVFSFKAVFDLANELILICPVSFLIICGLRRGRGADDGTSERFIIFLATAAIFYMAEFIVFNMNIGASRDWDLFAPMAIPLALLTAVVLLKAFTRRRGALAGAAVAVMLIHTVPWIMLNAGTESSESRFLHLVRHGFWSGHARGYGYSTLAKYHRALGNRRTALTYAREASKGDPGNVRYMYETAEIYDELGEYSRAAGMYRKVLGKKPDHIIAANNLGVDYIEIGRYDLAAKALTHAQSIDSADAASFQNLAFVYFEAGRVDEYIRLFRNASDPVRRKYLIMLLKARRFDGNYEKIEYLLSEMTVIDPGDIDIVIDYAETLYESGKKQEAVRYLLRIVNEGNRDQRVAAVLSRMQMETPLTEE